MGRQSRPGFRRAVAVITAAVIVVAATTAMAAQLGFFTNREPSIRNMKYDGRFAFARIRYETGPGGYYYCGLPAWAHGYQSCRGGERAEESLMKIVNELSFLNPHIDEGVVVALDDPELFKYPVSYMAEPGFWTLSPKEAAAFRSYLLKGGFVIFDDFRADDDPRAGGGWENLEANLKQTIPNAKFIDLDPTYPIFHSFFEIDSFDIVPQSYDRGRPIFRGLFEDNDPTKRLMAIINYSTDISDFWEFSATGFKPIDESNQAYKLGVNYLMYGLTH